VSARRRRGTATGPHPHPDRCPLCGTELIWPLHVPKRIKPGEQRRQIALDRQPDETGTGRYAVSGFGPAKRSRYLEPDESPDHLETRHLSHFATCPQQITPDELASMTQQNGPTR
jgi:hypothetical protein